MTDFVSVELSSDDVSKFKDAALDVYLATLSIGHIFKFFEDGLVDGTFSGQDAEQALVAVSRFCSRAMKHIAQNEGQALVDFSTNVERKTLGADHAA